MGISSAPSALTPMRIHTRCSISKYGDVTREQLVRCPVEGWTPLSSCQSCGHCEHLSTPSRTEDWVLLCRRGEDVIPLPAGPSTLGGMAAATTVAEAMLPAFCMEADVPAVIVARVFVAQEVDVGVVVDAEGHRIGVVSRTDLLRGLSSDARAEVFDEATVLDVMTPFAMTFEDTTPLADAMKLLAGQYLHHVPVVSGPQVVGVISPSALITWLHRTVFEGTIQ